MSNSSPNSQSIIRKNLEFDSFARCIESHITLRMAGVISFAGCVLSLPTDALASCPAVHIKQVGGNTTLGLGHHAGLGPDVSTVTT